MSQSDDSSIHQASSSYPGELTFIAIANPDELKDRSKQQYARTRSILNASKRDRQRLRERGKQFKLETVQSMVQKHGSGNKNNQALVKLPAELSLTSIDPFETLPVNATRFTELLNLKTSVAAGEPIFNIGQIKSFGALNIVFGTGLTDPGLTAALSMTLALADKNWQMNRECLEFEETAIKSLNCRLSSPTLAAESTTIGVVIILLGIEYRLDRPDRVKNHLKGLQGLLQLYHKEKVELNDALRRAIFWQDMLCSFIAKTKRVLSHSFYPSTITESLLSRQSRIIPDGFTNYSSILGPEFLELTADVSALYKRRLQVFSTRPNIETINEIDSYQALFESQLQEMLQKTDNPVLTSCILALFLCVYGFWDGIWKAALLPCAITERLAKSLDQCMADSSSLIHGDLLIWLTSMGLAFAVDHQVRGRFVTFQQENGLDKFDEKEKLSTLKDFIWSDVFHTAEHGSFWEHIQAGLQ